MAYQSFDEGYKILGSLDDKKRQKVIDNLKGSELAEHFALLKTSDERKQFLGWIGLEDWGTLYECYGGDSKKLKKFLGELNIEQIEQLINQVRSNHETEENEHEIKQLCEALPLEDLKVLIDKSVVEYPEYEARLHAEYFNTLETYNEKKGFVRHLDIVQIKNLYTYFKDDSKERKELCRAMPWEDLNLLAETVPGEHFEHWARTYAEEFSVLEESSDRRRFLEGFTTEELIRLYRYFDDDPDKQNLLCRSIPLKHLRSIIEEITYEESEVARSYLTKVNGI
jgi:hypothetical protein